MKIIFRADGDNVVGLGHIMRSAALMQMLQYDFQCEFWTNNPEYFPYADFEKEPLVRHFRCADIKDESKKLAAEASTDWIIVLDGYQFKTNYQLLLKKKGLTLVCIDDLVGYHFLADVIINHAGGISSSEYSKEKYTKIFSGPAYALVKPLFFHQPRPERNLENNEVLVSMGGADTHNHTDRILTRLIESSVDSIHVLLGAANQHYSKLVEKYKGKRNLHFHRDLSATAINALMRSCGNAILTPSTICYEYMSIGGIVYLHQTADNQERVKQYFLGQKLAFPFLNFPELNKAEINYSMEKQREIFDGKNTERFRILFTSVAKLTGKTGGYEKHW